MITETTPTGPEAPKKPLLTDGDVAVYLNVSLRHVKTLRSRRLLPYVSLGKAVRYRQADVEQALASLTIGMIAR